MKIAISNIAWPAAEESGAAEVMAELGVGAVEIAATKIWPNPILASPQQLSEYRAFWASYGVQIVATQALLYGREDLTIFEGGPQRAATLDYLERMLALAAALGAEVAVFGSPRNRRVRGLDPIAVRKIALPFFRTLGRFAASVGVAFCIEPNAAAYECDFIRTTDEAVDLIREIDHPAVRLHLDTGVMALNGEAIEDAIRAGSPWLRHFHVSEPFLGPVWSGVVPHRQAAAALLAARYDHWRSIEMRTLDTTSIPGVRAALQYVVDVYGR